MIRIHNSLTGEKQELKPVEPGHVRMYSCGMTVYDYFHVGNARMLVVFDMVSRYLRHRGLRVTYVRNITDVDDKIINRARETGVDWRAHAAKFTAAMHEDLDTLGCLRPEKEPKASEYIDEMLTMIGQLIDNGYAYQASNGDVMYDVHKFAPYGKLSGKKLEDLRAGSRVEVDTAKRDPLDFVLWKSAKPGEPAWPSPWGDGRPGWHIECSAMSDEGAGRAFRHSRRRARSEISAPRKRDRADLRRHRRQVRRDLDAQRLPQHRQREDVEVAGQFLHHARSAGEDQASRGAALLPAVEPVPRADELFARSARSGGSRRSIACTPALRDVPEVGGELHSPTAATRAFDAAMDDDFNTPEAIAVLQGLAREINTARTAGGGCCAQAKLLAGELRALARRARASCSVPAGAVVPRGRGAAGSATRKSRRRSRRALAARKAKNWAESDRIRDELAAAGVILEDKPGGVTTWRRGLMAARLN